MLKSEPRESEATKIKRTHRQKNKCKRCGGVGALKKKKGKINIFDSGMRTCRACGGTGRAIKIRKKKKKKIKKKKTKKKISGDV